MSKSLFDLIVVQFKGYWREPGVLFWTLAFPVGLAWILGVAFINPPDIEYRIAVVENFSKNESMLFDSNSNVTSIEFQTSPDSQIEKLILLRMAKAEVEKEMRKGKVLVQVNVLKSVGENYKVEYYFDPANAEAKVAYLWIQRWINKKLSLEKGDRLIESVHRVRQQGSRYIDFLIPGLIALGVMNSSLWGIGWTLVEYRIKKFLRRMIATPLRKTEFMIAISVTRIILGLIEAGLLLTFAHFMFGVKVQSGLLSFLSVFLAGCIAFMGIAVLAGSRTANTRIGNGIINAITVPMFILSGVFFSYENLPDWMVGWVQYLPLSVLADSLRLVMLQPVGLGELVFPVAYLCSFGFCFYFLGIRVYRWY